MARKILDQDLMEWEVYASTGDFGFPQNARVTFHCLTDLARRSRFVETGRDLAGTERIIEEASAQELASLFGSSKEID